jgi:hypothetical protein
MQALMNEMMTIHGDSSGQEASHINTVNVLIMLRDIWWKCKVCG